MWVRIVKARYVDIDYSGLWSMGGYSSKNVSSWW